MSASEILLNAVALIREADRNTQIANVLKLAAEDNVRYYTSKADNALAEARWYVGLVAQDDSKPLEDNYRATTAMFESLKNHYHLVDNLTNKEVVKNFMFNHHISD